MKKQAVLISFGLALLLISNVSANINSVGSNMIAFKDYAAAASNWLGAGVKPTDPNFVNECDNWQKLHPEWIFCDDFESDLPLVGQNRYFSHHDDKGKFAHLKGVGVESSKGMRAVFEPGKSEAGNLHLAFGKVPDNYFDKGIRSGEHFTEIYYRMYVKTHKDWQGGTMGKLSRAFSLAGVNGTRNSQAMIAHLWGSRTTTLKMDPVSLVDANSVVVSTRYNDFDNMTWLGADEYGEGSPNGTTPLFAAENVGRWHCIEVHVKLNDTSPQKSNGLQEFWINGKLEARRTGMNFVKSWDKYGINAIYFENYNGGGSSKIQERYFDNIVVSTEPIGCGCEQVK